MSEVLIRQPQDIEYEVNPNTSVAVFLESEIQRRIARSQMDELYNKLAIVLEERSKWSRESNCQGLNPDMFILEKGERRKDAQKVCDGCKVNLECLDFALQHQSVKGFWGGKTEKERIAIRSGISS